MYGIKFNKMKVKTVIVFYTKGDMYTNILTC